MELASKILSDITIYMKYSRYVKEKKRRESWIEICDRNSRMHKKKYPELSNEIQELYDSFIIPKKILPSMRSMQFAGKPIDLNPSRLYNCSTLAIDCIEAFSEVMFLLLGGCGVGFSVQKSHINKLPIIQGVIKPQDGRERKKRYLVGDSIEGWADAIKILINSYFNGTKEVDFDLRDIRPKGTELVSAGGKAPGPTPLLICLAKITSVFENALQERDRGTKLKSIECHDICCYIADAVLAGGIRRSATISLFSLDDQDMLYAKSGNWWESNPQRARANNSAVFIRGRIKKRDFDKFWEIVKNSGSGEPGIFFSHDIDTLTNPCGEISICSENFCNLTEINVSTVENQEDFNGRVRAATILGTLQASYFNFHYLRDSWREHVERDALLGVSMTGIASNRLKNVDLSEGAKIAVETNREWAEKIGINLAKRICTGKPAGTTSCVLGCSSGIHAWHSKYYFRRIRVNKDEAIYGYLKKKLPKLLEDDVTAPNTTAVLTIPQKAPHGAITREKETALDLLERVKSIYNEWILNGHLDGANTHNQSCTVSIKENEWYDVRDWMWKNRENYSGISVLPYDGGTYIQAPFEDCSKEQYEALLPYLKEINLSEIIESSDDTNLQGELACAGGACEI